MSIFVKILAISESLVFFVLSYIFLFPLSNIKNMPKVGKGFDGISYQIDPLRVLKYNSIVGYSCIALGIFTILLFINQIVKDKRKTINAKNT
jgi:hypothetical protein